MVIAVDPAWLAGLFREMLLDMAVILVVALVITMELAPFLFSVFQVFLESSLATTDFNDQG